jgi:hypothetical protein
MFADLAGTTTIGGLHPLSNPYPTRMEPETESSGPASAEAARLALGSITVLLRRAFPQPNARRAQR